MPKKSGRARTEPPKAKLLSMHPAYPLRRMKPYKGNPRNHEDTLDFLVDSLNIFGSLNPIVLRDDGTICAGHARFKAAKARGDKVFPAIKVRFENEAAFLAYMLADNQIASRSTWLSNEFGDIMDKLEGAGWLPKQMGFDLDMIATIRAGDIDVSDGRNSPVRKHGDSPPRNKHRD